MYSESDQIVGLGHLCYSAMYVVTHIISIELYFIVLLLGIALV